MPILCLKTYFTSSVTGHLNLFPSNWPFFTLASYFYFQMSPFFFPYSKSAGLRYGISPNDKRKLIVGIYGLNTLNLFIKDFNQNQTIPLGILPAHWRLYRHFPAWCLILQAQSFVLAGFPHSYERPYPIEYNLWQVLTALLAFQTVFLYLFFPTISIIQLKMKIKSLDQ